MWKLTLLCWSIGVSLACVTQVDNDWWKKTVVYQIYPRSFKDSNGDGIGDLNGITSKLEHLKDLGVETFWISPIYPSPQVDFGYDISNFTDVNPEYGTLADFQKLVQKAKSLGLKVLLDFVPNHSSPDHQWFKDSIKRIKPYDEFYVWRDAKIVNGQRQPPNNWLSTFGGSAWEWNEERGQYFLHQFAVGQPDLNYRSPALRKHMEDVLTFWLDRGVSGFRIDAINVLFEDDRFLDEPRSGNDVPETDHEYLSHVYTVDQDEIYGVVQSWRNVLDRHTKSSRREGYMMLMEAYTSMPNAMRYYKSGATPFNFLLITDLNGESPAVDFKKVINRWLNNMPKEYIANWVTGNHDQHRVATRFGPKREDQMTALAMTLPGIAVVYNGDEIGMVDRPFTFQETVDPAGCNAGPDRYQLKSRDPERTPYQWDGSTSAGFSTSRITWLPVNENYQTLNLAAQKASSVSHYHVFKALVALRKTPVLQKGSLDVGLVTDKVLGVVRRLDGYTPVVVLINTSNEQVEVDASAWLNIPESMKVYVASVKSEIAANTEVNTSKLTLPGAATVVLGNGRRVARR